MSKGKFISYLRVSTAGHTSVRDIAAELNQRGILTARGGLWHATSVVRLLERLAGLRADAAYRRSRQGPARLTAVQMACRDSGKPVDAFLLFLGISGRPRDEMRL